MSAFSNRTQIIFSFSSVGGAPVYACGLNKKNGIAKIYTVQNSMQHPNPKPKSQNLLSTCNLAVKGYL